jgi:toxin ParE1/3/4
MKIVFAPLARDTLRDIQTYIAADNISAAARVASEIRRTIETLETYPLIGQGYEGEVRRLVVTRYPYVVFYEVNQTDELVNILTVQHAHQRLPKLSRKAKY